jgi:hypothetical protein
MDEEMGRFERWLHNLSMFPQRLMMRYLRSRGWIVFWLDKPARHCGPNTPDGCWIKLYQEEIARGG